MAHGLVKAVIIPEIIRLIEEKYSVHEDAALDMFYSSATGASLADDETGLYGQSALYIFSLFSEEWEWKAEKYEKPISIPPVLKSELEPLINIIVNTVPVEQIYLFGSYAYGAPHKDSDLDLYVVLKDNVEMRELDAIVQILHAIGRVKTKPVDIIAAKKSRYLRLASGPTMERKIAREGIKIYG
ncbi:MAG: nucleotidyltransferase domain-containing protein [Treponema sp.]|jgi:predicted nucleotidyltransferase|nr:nucleotidyltransferase domain-containing protein [Treponema sp.]